MPKVELEIYIFKCDIFYFCIEELEDISQPVWLYNKFRKLPLKISTDDVSTNIYFPAVWIKFTNKYQKKFISKKVVWN